MNGENVALPALSVGIDCKPIAGDNLSFEKGVAGSILLKATSMIRRRHPRHAIATKSRKKPGLAMFFTRPGSRPDSRPLGEHIPSRGLREFPYRLLENCPQFLAIFFAPAGVEAAVAKFLPERLSVGLIEYKALFG